LSYKIEILSDKHDRSSFDCGAEPLDRYLKQQSSQDLKRGLAVVYAAREINAVHFEVAAYYTLSATGILSDDVPNDLRRKMPRYRTLPASLLGRLAVDLRHRSNKLGKLLLYDAFIKSLQSSLGWSLFVTDAKDDTARSFYEHFGFRSLNDTPRHLYITRQEILKTVR
jgi:predicted GNAT family N-acyltransferase